MDAGDDDGPRYNILEWTDKQLAKQLAHAAARLMHVQVKSVQKYDAARLCLRRCSCGAVHCQTSNGCVRGCRGVPLAEQMDSLTLAQLQGALARDFGLHIGNGEMFSEKMTIRYIVANRLVRCCARGGTPVTHACVWLTLVLPQHKSLPLDQQEFTTQAEMKAATQRAKPPFCQRYFPCCTCCY